MKPILKSIASMLSENGEVSSKRLYSGLLIISGVVMAFLNLNPENVRTLIFGGCGLLGLGAFAERIGGGRDI